MSEARSLFSSRSVVHAGLPRLPGMGDLAAFGRAETEAPPPKRPLRPLRLADPSGRVAGSSNRPRPGTPYPPRVDHQRSYFEAHNDAPESPAWSTLPSPGTPRAVANSPFFSSPKSGVSLAGAPPPPPLLRAATLTLEVPELHAPLSPSPSLLSFADAPLGTPGSSQAELLARRGHAPNRLGTNLQRKSLVPLAMLASILLSKIPLLYGAELTSRGLNSHNVAERAGGGALIATSTLMMWTGVGFGLYDTYKVKPVLQRDPRLRYLGPRSMIFSLSALALCAPFILIGATLALNHAAADHNADRVNWMRIPANVGASGQNFAAGFLYTVMQMRRGWTPLKLSAPMLFAAGTWFLTTQSQFGITCGKGNLPVVAQYVSVQVPYIAHLFIFCEMFSRLTYISLQNQLTDTTMLPWESGRGP